MPDRVLTASSAGDKQGWYSTSGSGSNSTITANFASAIDSFRSSVDVSNITINSATLKFKCAASGNADKKYFKLSTELGSLGTFRSSDVSYNAWTTVSLNATACNSIKTWIVNDKNYLYSTDPNPKRLGDTNYSYNYVKVTAATLTINYTVNKSSATLNNTTMNIGSSYGITITAGSTSYTHDILLIIGNSTYTLKKGVSSGSQTITIPTGIGTNEMAKLKTKTGIIRLITYNGSSNLGYNDYSITVQVDSSASPTISSVALSFSATPNTSFSGTGKVILNGRTNITLGITSTAKYGASISTYKVNGAGINISNSSGNFVFSINQVGSKVITITVTDSRGYTTSTTRTLYITNYSLPSLNNLIIYRCDSSGNRDDVGGKYAKITYSAVITNPITNATTTSTTYSNAITVKIGTTTLSNGKVFGGSYAVDSTYNLNIICSDTVGNSTTLQVVLPSSSYLLHFRKNQNSIGIGCAGEDLAGSSDTGRLTINWPTKFNNKITLSSALGIPQGGTGATNETGIVANIKTALINAIYPVGSIYMSVSPTNPSSIFGGTWVAWGAGRVPVGVASGDANFGSVEKTGGEKTHTLTIEETPAHYHVPSRGEYNDSNFYFTINATLGTEEVARRGVASSSSASGGYAMTSTNSNYIYDAPQTNTVGGGAAHNNIQPYITCYMWKRTA